MMGRLHGLSQFCCDRKKRYATICTSVHFCAVLVWLDVVFCVFHVCVCVEGGVRAVDAIWCVDEVNKCCGMMVQVWHLGLSIPFTCCYLNPVYSSNQGGVYDVTKQG